MTQADLLRESFILIMASGVCPKTRPRDWVKTLLFLHKKGYLWASVEEEKLVMVAAMYRVPDLEEKTIERYPEKEEGKILYIPFFASVAKDMTLANSLFKKYLKAHPEVEEIAFYDDRKGDKKLRRFKRNKEEVYGKR